MITGWEDLASSLTEAFGGDFVSDFIRTLQDERRAEEEMAFARQQRIAAATQALDASFMEGLGECHMRVDPTVFFHWVKKEGHGIWNDKSFLRAFKRDNKEVIVKSRSCKTTVRRP
jgi:hypothetical protein